MNTQYLPVKSYTINIQVESLDSPESTVPFDILLKVFNKFKLSFRHFIEIEFLKNPEFIAILERNPRVLEEFKRETELVILHLDIDKLQASIAPVLTEDEDSLFVSEILCWKRDTFEKFKKSVIFCNYHEPLAIKKIMAEYSLSERVKIYKPIFDVVSYDKTYKVNVLSAANKLIGMLIPPHNVTRNQMLSAVKLSLDKQERKNESRADAETGSRGEKEKRGKGEEEKKDGRVETEENAQ